MKFSNPFKNGRIPTLFGIVLLFLTLGVTVFLSQGIGNLTRFFSSASTEGTVNGEIVVSNISSDSFTVSWTTEKETIGRVYWSTEATSLIKIANDQRDVGGKVQSRFTHLVRVGGLNPETEYFFKIGESGPSIGSSDGNAIRVLTFRQLEPRSVDPLFGSVDLSKISSKDQILVTWKTSDSSPLTVLSTSEGKYVLPVALARTSTGDSYVEIQGGVDQTVVFNDGQTQSVLTCDGSFGRPFPVVTLGEDATCQNVESEGKKKNPPNFEPPVASSVSAGFSTSQINLNIQNGQSVDNVQPTISGKVGPDQTVTIEVHSDTPYSGTVKANPDGSWTWTPPGTLSPGEHTVTITVVNADGTTTKETRTFFVVANQEILPITSATPSAKVYHNSCVANACVQIEGEGENACQTSNDCLPPPVEEPPSTPPAVEPPSEPPPVTGAFEDTLLVLTLSLGFLTLGAGIFLFGAKS